MIQSDIIDSELIEGSEGIQEDLHYSKSCGPVIKKSFFYARQQLYKKPYAWNSLCQVNDKYELYQKKTSVLKSRIQFVTQVAEKSFKTL